MKRDQFLRSRNAGDVAQVDAGGEDDELPSAAASSRGRVKQSLLPLPMWKAFLERLLECLPRRVYCPVERPTAGLRALPGDGSRWLATSADPWFELDFGGLRLPRGWVYLETSLRRSMGDRAASLEMVSRSGSITLELLVSNLRGSIRELLHLPDDLVSLRWRPCFACGYFSQLPIVMHEVSAFESGVRMLDRVLTQRLRSTRMLQVNGGVLALRHRHVLEAAYKTVSTARHRGDVDSYSAYLRAEPHVAGASRLAGMTSSVPREAASRCMFVIHRMADSVDDDSSAAWVATMASLEAQLHRRWAISGDHGQQMRAASADANDSAAWHVRLLAGDVLLPDALLRLAQVATADIDCQVIYTDHDFLDGDGQRHAPVFKPDWDLDLFCTHNYLANLCAVRIDRDDREIELSAEAFHRRVLVAARRGGRAIAHVPLVLCHRRVQAGRIAPFGGEASALHAACGHDLLDGAVLGTSQFDGARRVIWPLPQELPLVSVIVPTRDRVEILRPCVASVLSKTSYPRFEVVIVDNDSRDIATLNYLKEVVQDSRVRVLRHSGAFNFSAINNAAVGSCTGDLLLFLNNDTEVVSPDWMTDLARHALRPSIGAVGAKLLYTDGLIQHAGVVLGIGGVAGHVHRFLPDDHPGYCGRAVLAHSFSAVTAACMMVRRALFDAVGGFNETDLMVALNDVDLCLKLRALGHRCIYEPAVVLFHHESLSRGADDTPEKRRIFERERSYMLRTWGTLIADDPAYNPNLTREYEDMSVASD